MTTIYLYALGSVLLISLISLVGVAAMFALLFFEAERGHEEEGARKEPVELRQDESSLRTDAEASVL